MIRKPGSRVTAIAALALAFSACVPVTVNVTFPQEKLDAAARHIEEGQAQPAGAPPATASPPAPAAGQSRTVSATPQLDTRAPEVEKATESRRQRRPALREWKSRGCIGETNQGFVVARPGDGCGAEAADLIRAENADRRVIYGAFIKENNIPASDTKRVQSAFAKARQERARPNDWIQLEDGQWVRKS
jgi:uncharacterized protein YdbL (DUF1318 family)